MAYTSPFAAVAVFIAAMKQIGATLVLSFGVRPGHAEGLSVTLKDQRDNALGTPQNSLTVTGGGSTATQAPPGANSSAVDGIQGVDGGNPVKTTPNGCAMSYATVTGTSGTLLVGAAGAKFIEWMNVGAADITVVPGTTPPTVGQGIIYSATAAGKQGASESFAGAAVPTNAFSFSAASSTTIAVEVCQ